MACPTCDHSLACMASGHNEAAYYHCPRCGTNVITCLHTGRTQAVYVPQLIERCRLFVYGGASEDGMGALTKEAFQEAKAICNRLGILEAIHKPEDRQ